MKTPEAPGQRTIRTKEKGIEVWKHTGGWRQSDTVTRWERGRTQQHLKSGKENGGQAVQLCSDLEDGLWWKLPVTNRCCANYLQQGGNHDNCFNNCPTYLTWSQGCLPPSGKPQKRVKGKWFPFALSDKWTICWEAKRERRVAQVHSSVMPVDTHISSPLH